MLHGLVEWEDLDVFFDEFAIHATLMANDDDVPRLALTGIFDTPYQKREFGSYIVDADNPSFTCKWHDDFSKVRKGDTLRVTNEGTLEDFYLDSAPQNDGTGVVAFILTRASTQDASGDDLDDSVDEPPPTGSLFG